MTKDTKNALLERLSCFEWLSESETFFLYVVMPILCVIGIYFLAAALWHLMLDAHSASASADLLSIDPDKWFPRA